MFSAGVLMPLGRDLADAKLPGIPAILFLPILFQLWLSLQTRAGESALIRAIPWVLLLLAQAAYTLLAWNRRRDFSASALCFLAAGVFPLVGGGWLLAYCAGWMPFGFDALIVLLTAAHFHHAGFTLPLIAGLQAEHRACAWTRGCCLLVLAGVPWVATGITCTHFGLLRWVEPIGVAVLVCGALGVAVEQLRTALMAGMSSWLRAGFFFSGLSLFIAMLLALAYGLRTLLPGLALPMPQMWAIHGSLNAFGFGLLGLLAWRCHHGGAGGRKGGAHETL
ncbi:MAG: YndJ family protein [Prosthecobacter sp.]|nr:YndJ family protein [Prosthecobacter sp.]